MCIRDRRYTARNMVETCDVLFTNFPGLLEKPDYKDPVSYTHLDVYKRQPQKDVMYNILGIRIVLKHGACNEKHLFSITEVYFLK